jgi:hypothetical protein
VPLDFLRRYRDVLSVPTSPGENASADVLDLGRAAVLLVAARLGRITGMYHVL